MSMGVIRWAERLLRHRSRLFVDITTLLRWSGPAVGMVRVEAELVRFALTSRPDVKFVFLDRESNAYRAVHRELVQLLLEGVAIRDMPEFPANPPARLVGELTAPASRATSPASPRSWARTPLHGIVRSSRLSEERAQPSPDTVVLAPGAEWEDKDPATVLDLKRRHGHRLAMVCHDVIPILFPHLFTHQIAHAFHDCFRAASGFVDRFICVSQSTARDLRAFYRMEGIPAPEILVQTLAARLPPIPRSIELPAGLGRRRFVLYVSTIEPRKNHRLLYRVWKRLSAAGVLDETGFRLVFVGRVGWQMDSFLRELALDHSVAGTIIHLQDLADETLAALYATAAFCVYPSLYEGFGLPLIEAMTCGRAVMASNGGAIPETLGGCGLCLDPNDEESWFKAMRSWICDPGAVATWEETVRRSFRSPSWEEAGASFLRHAEELAGKG